MGEAQINARESIRLIKHAGLFMIALPEFFTTVIGIVLVLISLLISRFLSKRLEAQLYRRLAERVKDYLRISGRGRGNPARTSPDHGSSQDSRETEADGGARPVFEMERIQTGTRGAIVGQRAESARSSVTRDHAARVTGKIIAVEVPTPQPFGSENDGRAAAVGTMSHPLVTKAITSPRTVASAPSTTRAEKTVFHPLVAAHSNPGKAVIASQARIRSPAENTVFHPLNTKLPHVRQRTVSATPAKKKYDDHALDRAEFGWRYSKFAST